MEFIVRKPSVKLLGPEDTMKTVCSRSAAALALVAALVGCKKDGRATDEAELPAEMRPHLAHIDVAKLSVPALFASVPADSPYLFAALEPLPVEFYGKMKQAFGPLFARFVGQAQAADNKVLAAVLSELDGKWNQAGLESLGFSARPAFAVYGLGLQPVVARVELRDHKAVLATIERIAGKAGQALPPMETKDGRNYWKFAGTDGPAFVVALADNQLIAAIGKRDDLDAKLGLILGTDKPSPSMADGKPIKELIARHGFGANLVGFADTRRLTTAGIAEAGAKPSPACTAEADHLAGRVPRVAFGYGEMSASRISGGMVIELASDLVPDLRALKVELPGLTAALADQPLIAMAAALDLARGQQLAVAAASAIKRLGDACNLPDFSGGVDRAMRALGKPLPDPIGQILGGAIAVRQIEFATGANRSPVPQKLEGVAMLASPDAKALFDKLAAQAPPLKALAIPADGKLHDVDAKLPIPFPISAGVGDKLIVLAAGDQRAALGGKLIGAHGGGKAPLLAMSYDYAKVFELEFQASGMSRADFDRIAPGVLDGMSNLFGRVAGTVDVTDAGVAFWGSLELK
jgi:hypothetical protein